MLVPNFLGWFVRHRMVAATGALALLAIPAVLTWETRHAIRQARARTESASSISATLRPLERPLPPDVETVGTQTVFRDAAVLHGHLFVAGPQGLVEYDANGALVRRFRTGPRAPALGARRPHRRRSRGRVGTRASDRNRRGRLADI